MVKLKTLNLNFLNKDVCLDNVLGLQPTDENINITEHKIFGCSIEEYKLKMTKCELDILKNEAEELMKEYDRTNKEIADIEFGDIMEPEEEEDKWFFMREQEYF
jgi:hypothetical protein